MGFPADRAGGARKKFWLGLPRSTLQYESHLLSMNAEHPQISRAICSVFSYHFLPSMLCVPAPCGGTRRSVVPRSGTCDWSHVALVFWGFVKFRVKKLLPGRK